MILSNTNELLYIFCYLACIKLSTICQVSSSPSTNSFLRSGLIQTNTLIYSILIININLKSLFYVKKVVCGYALDFFYFYEMSGFAV